MRTAPVGLAVLLVFGAGWARAQAPVESPGIRAGAFTLWPAVSFSTGPTSNINREADAVAAYENTVHSHVGFARAPARFRLEGFGAIEVSRFSVETEGGTNVHAAVQTAYGGPRLLLRGEYFLRNGGARPSDFDDISQKSRRLDQQFIAGVETRLGARVTLSGNALFAPTRYDADALYQGSSLDEKLTYDRTGLTGSLGYDVTPLTRISTRVEWSRDHFLKAPRLDTERTRALIGLELQPSALISGAFYGGILRTGAPDPGARPYTGFTMAGVLTYSRSGGTLAVARLGRDMDYSPDTDLSYYVSTLIDLSLRQDVAGPLEGFIYSTWYKLRYQGRDDLPGDNQRGLGVGVAVRLGRFVRLGANVDRTVREGSAPWTANRLIGFLTYGTGFRQVERPIPTDRYR